MTLEDITKLKKQFPTAWDVMMDRLWELDRSLLIELLMSHMAVGDCLITIAAIQKDVDESTNEEKINGSYH